VDLASRFAHGRDVLLPEATHFIPMEVPERVAEEIGKLAAEVAAVPGEAGTKQADEFIAEAQRSQR
jgi:hypothetical protein